MKLLKLFTALLLLLSEQSFAEWQYNESKDKMTDKVNNQAFIDSDNNVKLQFPYDKSQKGHLVIIRAPNDSLKVVFYVYDGQVHCGYSNNHDCELRVRFNETESQNWPYRILKNSNSIIFENSKDFINKIQESKSLLIEVPFYNNPHEIFEFSTSGLDLNRVK